MKIAKSLFGLACTNKDPIGIIGASLDARLCLNIKETASILGLSENTEHRLVKRKTLIPLRHLRYPLIPAAQIIALTGGEGQVIHLPSKSPGSKKDKSRSPTHAPSLEQTPVVSGPFLPGFSPEEVMAIQTPSSTMEPEKGGCE
jgi:hypothetical protein